MPRNLLLDFAPQFEDRTPQARPVQRSILDDLVQGLVQSGVDMFTAGGQALQGRFRRTPTTPGQWSDEDEAMQQIMDAQLARRGMDAALNMVGAPGLTGGMAGLGSGAARMRYNPLTDPERMGLALEQAVAKRGRGIPVGEDAAGWNWKRPDPEKGSWAEAVAAHRAALKNDISTAREGYRFDTNPLMSPDDWRFVDSRGGTLWSGAADKRASAGLLAMDQASRMRRAAEQGYTVDAYKGLMPYDWQTMPTRNGRGEVIAGADLIPQELRTINTPDRPHAGFFSSDPEVANRFAGLFTGPDVGGAVLPAKLKFENPLVIDAKGKPAAAFQFDSVAREHGTTKDMEAFRGAFGDGSKHDGVILKNTKDEGTVYVTRNADQTRSRFAAFDPKNEGSGMILGSGTQDARAAAAAQGIRAYHGSPHDFDRFDLSKIGTGEGAQAYGHGLYFAENEGVAKGYRDALATGPAAELVRLSGGDVQKAIEMARKNIAAMEEKVAEGGRWSPEYWPKRLEQGRQTLRDLEAGNPGGRMYEVNINADPAHFLDWDKPLNEQSQHVRDALAKLDAGAHTAAPQLSAIKDPEIRSFVRRALKANEGQAQGLELAIDNDGGLYKAISEHARRNKVDLDALDMRPSDYVYKHAAPYLDALSNTQNMSGDAVGRLLGVKGSDPMAAGMASAKVREAGIPGIKYLDQGSRDPVKMRELADDLAQYREAAKHWAATGNEAKLKIAQKQIEVLEKRLASTSNYVVFDDKLIDIVRKYGIGGLSMLGPSAAAFMSHKLKPVDYDPFGQPVDHDPFADGV